MGGYASGAVRGTRVFGAGARGQWRGCARSTAQRRTSVGRKAEASAYHHACQQTSAAAVVGGRVAASVREGEGRTEERRERGKQSDVIVVLLERVGKRDENIESTWMAGLGSHPVCSWCKVGGRWRWRRPLRGGAGACLATGRAWTYCSTRRHLSGSDNTKGSRRGNRASPAA